MRALVYQGPGKKALEERPMPEITAPTDVIVQVTKTTICGTDLHILGGDVPSCEAGRVLGHEGVGVVHEVGAGISGFKAGGSWATGSTARRPSLCASRTGTRASTPSPTARTRRRL